MSFAWPDALLGLLLVPMIAGSYAWVLRSRRQFSLRYSSTSLVRQAVDDHAVRRHVPAAMYLLALSAMFVALARPTSTIVTAESNATVILVIDVSGSMRSTDIKPSRIDAAKSAVHDFVNKQPKGMKVGLVAFAESAVLVTPPTEDKKQVQEAVATLGLGRGTNIGDGLRVGLQAILQPDLLEPSFSATSQTPATPVAKSSADPENSVILLLSDGAATTGPSPLAVADEIARTGIKTYTVGLGTTSGVAPPAGPQFGGFGGRFMELDEATLQGIADKTSGKYYTAENAAQLKNVYGQLTRKVNIVTTTTEVTFVATGVALLFMLGGAVLSMMWSSRLP